MIKLSKKHLTFDLENKLIKLMRDRAKKDPIILNNFKKYDVSTDIIDTVPIKFDDIDVSAKTVNKKITLNRKLILNIGKDADFDTIQSYLVHELVHLAQQTSGQVSRTDKNEDYLDQKTEQQAFKAQIQFKKREDGPEEAEKYTEDLLNYHGLKGKEREEVKNKLTKNTK